MEDFLAGKLRFAFEPPQKVKNSTQSDVTWFLSFQSNFTLSSWWPLWRGVTPFVLLFSALIFIDCLRCRQSNRRDYVAQFHLRLLHSTRSRIFCRNVFLLLLLCKLSDRVRIFTSDELERLKSRLNSRWHTRIGSSPAYVLREELLG